MSAPGLEVAVDELAPDGARRLGATIGDPRPFAAGDELPLLWHWAYFAALVPTSGLGPDGHPPRTDAYVGRFPRRMAGGGSVERRGPLVIGRPAQRRSEVERAEEVRGRSGDLAIVTWRHEYLQDGAVVRVERQHLVYRGAPTPPAPASPAGSPPPAPSPSEGFRRRLGFDPVLLFRYSAATWNSHRIHYDRSYVVGVEGYRGLLVHGPLLATLLAAEAEAELGPLARVEYRARAPVFDDDTVDVLATSAERGAMTLEARKPGGEVAMTLEAHGLD
ncbi:MAG TPA: hypothetical protein VKV23_04285 [Acidimicrobiales bacterium]|nr:hypothetical protein [Acidimicrobiales bacterium]